MSAAPHDDFALLLAAEIGFHLNARDESARRVLAHLASTSPDNAVSARAAYLAGRAFWISGDRESAWTHFAIAFRKAEARPLFLRSGCALFLLRREDKSLGADDAGLLQQLATCRALWTVDLRDEVRPAKEPARRGRGADWIVGFYRSQISPAIGHRCSLEPSCSEYFLQASRAHGWMGVPLIGDRLVREPGVVNAAEMPVERNGRTRYRDPLEQHTEWFKQ